jgi:hypothetical protein
LDRLSNHGLEAFRLYYGSYRAEVLENADANHQGRIRVRVHELGDTGRTSRVAYPKIGFGGNGHGLKSSPVVGDWVWVQFEGGRIDCPVWTSGIWPKDGVPEPLRDPKSHGWVTPGGHHVLLDERDGEEFVRIKHTVGSTIEFDKDGNIKISNTSGKVVYVGDGADEWAAKGETLKRLLEELIDAINAITVPTAMGPSGVPNNSVQFSSIKSRLEQFLSQVVKVK